MLELEVRRLHRHHHYFLEWFLMDDLLIDCLSLPNLVNPLMTYEQSWVAFQKFSKRILILAKRMQFTQQALLSWLLQQKLSQFPPECRIAFHFRVWLIATIINVQLDESGLNRQELAECLLDCFAEVGIDWCVPRQLVDHSHYFGLGTLLAWQPEQSIFQ